MIVPKDKYEVGKTYEVKAEDCCVRVLFTAKLNMIEWGDDLKHEFDPLLGFDNHVQIRGMGVELREVNYVGQVMA